jgi:GcrA cell cycle regulator
MNDEKEWTAAESEKLRELWADSNNSAERIGGKMKRSKNSILGKVHRMGLPGRRSPIKTLPAGQERSVDKRRKPPPPPLAALVQLTVDRPKQPSKVAKPAKAPAHYPIVLKPVVIPQRPSSACCWPLGDPKRDGFRFCDADAKDGRSYCVAHCAKAYTTWPAANVAQGEGTAT